MQPTKSERDVLPPEIFEILPALYPRFARALQECELSAAEIYALSAIKHSGKQIEGRNAILVSDLTDQLSAVVGYHWPSGASTVIGKLVERGFVDRRNISSAQKKEVFGLAYGSKSAVILRPAGLVKLTEAPGAFNRAANRLVTQLDTPEHMSWAARRAIVFIFDRFRKLAPHLLKALHSKPVD